MGEMDLTEIYRVFHSTATDFTFFSAVHQAFSKSDHLLGLLANFNKYKKIKIISCILTNHIRRNYKSMARKNYKNLSNSQRLNNTVSVVEQSIDH
jgi:hypothetical protein